MERFCTSYIITNVIRRLLDIEPVWQAFLNGKNLFFCSTETLATQGTRHLKNIEEIHHDCTMSRELGPRMDALEP